MSVLDPKIGFKRSQASLCSFAQRRRKQVLEERTDYVAPFSIDRLSVPPRGHRTDGPSLSRGFPGPKGTAARYGHRCNGLCPQVCYWAAQPGIRRSVHDPASTSAPLWGGRAAGAGGGVEGNQVYLRLTLDPLFTHAGDLSRAAWTSAPDRGEPKPVVSDEFSHG